MRPPLKRHLYGLLTIAFALFAANGAAVEPSAEDVSPGVPFQEGEILDFKAIEKIKDYLPPPFWKHRDLIFFEGMQMEIGPCYRRYKFPEFWNHASEKFAGRASIDDEGNLRGYVAGIPFAPDSIDPTARDSGIRWAWNLEHRYRGSGPVGDFRLVDMPTRFGGIQTYLGSSFFIQTRHRADLAETDYVLLDADDTLWIAGGRFDEPNDARHLAWKQLRPTEVHTDYSEADDTFVYVPSMRKVRRAATVWVDGLYMPRYRVGGDAGGGAIPLGGGNPYAPAATIQPNTGDSAKITENLRRGFVGMSLRPNAYVWRVLRERPVLAPLNSIGRGYPIAPDRNFGPSGLSVASDRWDVRWAVVIQGLLRDGGHGYDRLTQQVRDDERDGDDAQEDPGGLVHRSTLAIPAGAERSR